MQLCTSTRLHVSTPRLRGGGGGEITRCAHAQDRRLQKSTGCINRWNTGWAEMVQHKKAVFRLRAKSDSISNLISKSDCAHCFWKVSRSDLALFRLGHIIKQSDMVAVVTTQGAWTVKNRFEWLKRPDCPRSDLNLVWPCSDCRQIWFHLKSDF